MLRKIEIIAFVYSLLSISSCSSSSQAEVEVVKNLDEFNEAVALAKAGTVITLANGIWDNVELKLEAKGTQEDSVFIKAETPGHVFITGQSNLSFSGEFISISGLVFKDGYTPTSEVISYRTGKNKLANNSRVSNCVIDHFSNPERFDTDYWVSMYGKNNRFDHNTLIGKGNKGVTMAVRLNTEESLENNHKIDFNFFGTRKPLGSNGGETLRIGTSHYSRSYSNTLVENNYFEKTSGELEIISSKSCGNVFRNNVFFESKGTLTMRHGHHTTVENNYFLGNRKPNTGGIRIINEYQNVTNNYIYGLTGYRFRSALTIMNGVPNSPINRYNQVIDSHMTGNVVIDSDHVQLCAGSDEERSAIPTGSSFKDNIVLTTTNPSPFTLYDDVSGIDFSGNIVRSETELPFEEGFEKVDAALVMNENGLISPPQAMLDQIGFKEIKLPITKEEAGASYYDKDATTATFNSGETINVVSGENTLLEAIANSKPGDVLMLENGGEYLMTKYAFIHHPISIVAPAGDKPILLSEKQSFFKIENGGALFAKNVRFDGAESPDYAGNNVISTSKYSMNRNYAVHIEACEVIDLDKNHSFDFIKSYKHTFADSINIIDTKMTNVSGAVITMDMEVEDLGIYNVENVKIINTTFSDVKHEIVNVYRGGTDESTFGPIITVKDVHIRDSGKGKRNKIGAALRFHGVQKLLVDNVEIIDSKGIDLFMTNGEPITKLSNITFENSEQLKTNNQPYEAKNIIVK